MAALSDALFRRRPIVDVVVARVERLAAGINEQILTELSQVARYTVVGASDIATLIGLERQKQLQGCGEDSESCMAELGNALGVEGVLVDAGWQRFETDEGD